MTEATKTPARKNQGRLPGTEDPVIEAIEGAAEAYVEVRDKRMALTELEVKANEVLVEIMKKHGRKVYKYDGKTVKIQAETKIKAKVSRDSGNAEVE